MKKKGNFLSGVLGPLKFSVRNNQQIVSGAVAPGTMKQSKATKKASTVFGKAAALSKELRLSLAALYPDLFGNSAINDLTGQMYPILKDCKDPNTDQYFFARQSFARLEQLEFNVKSKVSTLMSQKPVVNL